MERQRRGMTSRMALLPPGQLGNSRDGDTIVRAAMQITPLDRIFLIIFVLVLLRAGLALLRRWLAGKPLLPEQPEDLRTPTFKCPNCDWTLLYGMEKCDSCGVPIDQGEAFERTVVRYYINRAVDRANTLLTLSPALVVMLALAVFFHFSGQRYHVFVAVGNTLLYTAFVAAWSYRYADLLVDHERFRTAQRRMRLHLHLYLAASSAQIILVILTW